MTKIKRAAGILLSITSLPSGYGIGDLGRNAHKFVDFLNEIDHKYWQILPLGPTGFGDSPYQSFSAFAGNELLISPEKLAEKGLIALQEITNFPEQVNSKIEYGRVIKLKHLVYSKAFNVFNSKYLTSNDFEGFCTEHSGWLEDYSLFRVLKDFFPGKHWLEWPTEFKNKNQCELEKFKHEHLNEINFYKFLQFEFFNQWAELKNYATEQNINIIGDIPIFVASDSADLWSNPELFYLDENKNPLVIAGCPPDYFSPTGQLWGNPLYNWKRMEEDNFGWWKQRIASLLKLVDIIRIDHFRGFEAYWEIPANSKTAENGKWVKASGYKFFNELKKEFNEISIIAEDLGVITKEVEKLRDDFDLPGLKILQFAFGGDATNPYLPHNFLPNSVVYTGSHDNETLKGFLEREKELNSNIIEHAKEYLNSDYDNLFCEIIRSAYSSVAKLVILPMQDFLELGNEARMNFPGKAAGNWQWRFDFSQIKKEKKEFHKKLINLYNR